MPHTNPKVRAHHARQHIKRMVMAEKALDLYLKSWNWREIAQELGLANPSVPWAAVQALLVERPAEHLATWRKIELPRLETLRKAYHKNAHKKLTGLAAYLQITDRIHRLMGISSKVEVTGKGGKELPAAQTTVNVQLNLGALNADELRTLDAFLAKAGTISTGDHAGNGSSPALPEGSARVRESGMAYGGGDPSSGVELAHGGSVPPPSSPDGEQARDAIPPA